MLKKTRMRLAKFNLQQNIMFNYMKEMRIVQYQLLRPLLHIQQLHILSLTPKSRVCNVF
jgi:hypothetical protein